MGLPTMEEFLQREYIEWVRRKGRMASAAEFARWLDVSNTSLSQWMTGNRAPVGDNIHKLASKLGPVVYDILGEPRRMPDDPLFNQAATAWFAVNHDVHKRILRELEEEAEKARKIDDEEDKISPA